MKNNINPIDNEELSLEEFLKQVTDEDIDNILLSDDELESLIEDQNE